MKLEQLLLILAGLTGIGAFFLPFVEINTAILSTSGDQLSVSGYTFTRVVLDRFGLLEFDQGKGLILALEQMWNAAKAWEGYLTVGGFIAILVAPLIYVLYSLGYIFRGLTGRSYKCGIWFNLLFMGAGYGFFFWLSQRFSTSINFLGQEVTAGLKFNFFEMVGIGYWLAFAAVFVAGFSLIFEKPKAKTK